MAKSLRSKQRRKMRAIKRESYAKKELEMLKRVVANGIVAEQAEDKEMKAEPSIKTDGMDVDQQPGQIFNKKTRLNENGNYPVWMNSRKIKKQRKKNKVGKRKNKT